MGSIGDQRVWRNARGGTTALHAAQVGRLREHWRGMRATIATLAAGEAPNTAWSVQSLIILDSTRHGGGLGQPALS